MNDHSMGHFHGFFPCEPSDRCSFQLPLLQWHDHRDTSLRVLPAVASDVRSAAWPTRNGPSTWVAARWDGSMVDLPLQMVPKS